MTDGAETLRNEKYDEVQESLRDMHEGRSKEFAVAAGAGPMVVVTFLLWLMLRALLGRPVVSLTAVMKRLAGGDNRVEVPDTNRGDELGEMAPAVLVFRDAAVAKEADERAKALADAEQQRVVEALSGGLGRPSEGDLTAEIGADSPAAML